MDAKKKPTWSGHIRSSAVHQDQSSSSPLAQVRVDHGGFVPHLGVGNWADDTSLSPLDKHWGWPQRGAQVPIQAVAAGTVMPSTKRSSSERDLSEDALAVAAAAMVLGYTAPAGQGILAGRHDSSQLSDAHMFQ